MGQYKDLLKHRGFNSLLWTQFLGVFNDNVCRIVVSMLAVNLAAGSGSESRYLALAGVALILPYFLFSGYAGYAADVFSKRGVLFITKAFEIIAMGFSFLALLSGQISLMLCALFLMAIQATFFSPAKYGILPEMLPDKELSSANGLLEMGTFLAIILGTSTGSIMLSFWKDRLWLIGLVLTVIALAGTITSLGISKVPPSGARKPFLLNPWAEIGSGLKRIYGEKILWLTAIGIAYSWFLAAFLQMDIILLGKEVMGLDDMLIGLLAASLAIGVGIGCLMAGYLSGRKVEPGLVPLGSLGMGVFSILLFLSTSSYKEAIIMLVLLGCSGGLFIVPLNAIIQQKSRREEKGQLLATSNFMNIFGVLLATGIFWILRDILRLEADRIIFILGILMLIGTVYILSILPDFMVRFILWLVTHTIYRIRIVGEEYLPSKGPALLVCNHVSHVDGILVGVCIQRFIRFLLHKPYYEIKMLRWFFRLMKAIPITTENRREMLESLDRAREELRLGHVVCIFAEGAISRTGNMLPFKKGFERIILGLDVPVIPVHLDRLWGSIFSFKDGRFFWKWPRKIPYPVTVSFGKPLASNATAQQVRNAVMELGSEAALLRQSKNDLLHLKFIVSAKKEWFKFCMADSTGKEMTYGKTLISGLTLSRKIRKRCRGQRMIGILLPSSIGGALANIAVLLAGGIPVNLNLTAGREAMTSAIDQCTIKTIITSQAFIKKIKITPMPEMVYLEEMSGQIKPLEKGVVSILSYLLPGRMIFRIFSPEKQDPHSLATVIFSSGSTVEPKGIMLSHYNILSNIEAISQIFWITSKDRIMGVLPFFHSFGFTGTLWFPLIARFGALYHPNPKDAKTVGKMLHRYKATILIGTPALYSSYIRRCAPEEFSSLRYAVAGADKLKKDIADKFHKKFKIELLEGYGCTELAPVVSVNIPDLIHGSVRQRGKSSGTVGHPIPGIAVKVVDPDTGIPLPAGNEGLLLVKGPNLMLGYLNQTEKTAEVIQKGWYNTGNFASIDEEGFIRITDRISRYGTDSYSNI